jgi:hypothetical protein
MRKGTRSKASCPMKDAPGRSRNSITHSPTKKHSISTRIITILSPQKETTPLMFNRKQLRTNNITQGLRTSRNTIITTNILRLPMKLSPNKSNFLWLNTL